MCLCLCRSPVIVVASALAVAISIIYTNLHLICPQISLVYANRIFDVIWLIMFN